MDPMDRIIWSADVADEETLMRNLDLMSPRLPIVKIDRLFLTRVGLGVIDRLNERGIRVFVDAKIIEIPSKLLAIAEEHLKHRPWMLNCMAGGLSTGFVEHDDSDQVDALKRFADLCLQAGTKPCGVTVLTSKTERICEEEFDHPSIAQVIYYTEMLRMCGFTDVVCSPKELQSIREDPDFDSLDLNTPGIRPGGSSQDDQARTDTPEAALKAGATRLVIGRPITAGDPAENLKRIAASIASVS